MMYVGFLQHCHLHCDTDTFLRVAAAVGMLESVRIS
jgi:hypothetical protein